MPAPGDVDIVIAAELMEAGARRSARPRHARPHDADRLLAPHAAVREKMEPGDGSAARHGSRAARRSLEALPRLRPGEDRRRERQRSSPRACSARWPAQACSLSRAKVSRRRSGRAARAPRRASKAFAAGYEARADAARRKGAKGLRSFAASAGAGRATRLRPQSETGASMDATPSSAVSRCSARPEAIASRCAMAGAGSKRWSTSRTSPTAGISRPAETAPWRGAGGERTSRFASRREISANAMAYDDVIRVADLKTRAARFRARGKEMGLADQVCRSPNSCIRASRRCAARCRPGSAPHPVAAETRRQRSTGS